MKEGGSTGAVQDGETNETLSSAGKIQSLSANGSVDQISFIAFYLTQFHPTEENDLWWGKGFTEWTNVTKADSLFEGHYQPHLPTDLGFYDLRLRETRRDQIRLAKEYGLDGFCYHYYWFSGKRILNKPLDDMLLDKESDMPFCLCWANENWTRRWDAADHEVLIAQKYAPEDDLEFIKSLIPFFEDSRYIRIKDEPFLIVYRPQHMPDARRSAQIWRDYCKRIGIGEIHICAALIHGNEDYEQFGFDSGVQFPPHNLKGCEPVNREIDFHAPFDGNVMQYKDIATSYLDRQPEQKNVFRTVFPSWDNAARTGPDTLVTLNGTPCNYEYWLAETKRRTAKDFPDEERFIFINAWNEWAEGCHLEPDRIHGRGFLEATLRAKKGLSEQTSFQDVFLPRKIQPVTRALFNDLAGVFRYHAGPIKGRLKLLINKFPRLKAVLVYLLRLAKRAKLAVSG